MNARVVHKRPADVLVLFGATGDLAKKKLFPAIYSMVESGFLNIPIFGVASSKWDHTQFAQHAIDGITAAFPETDAKALEKLDHLLDLIVGDYSAEHGSTVVSYADDKTEAFMCGAYDRDGKCGDCRACWDKTVKVVAYPAHGMSMMAKVRKMTADLNANKNVWDILDGYVSNLFTSFWRF